MTGNVKWFVRRRGYGVITDDSNNEYFVHFTNINANDGDFRVLYPNEEVTFDVKESDDKHKLSAVNVTVTKRSDKRFDSPIPNYKKEAVA